MTAITAAKNGNAFPEIENTQLWLLAV